MGGRVIKVYLFIEVLVCFIWVKVGSHPQPMTLFYQNQNQHDEGVIMSPESMAPAQDRMDTFEEESSPPISTFTFPVPPPQFMPLFRPISAPQQSNGQLPPAETKRTSRTANLQDFGGETHWMFSGNNNNPPEIPGMITLTPPFIIPEYASLPMNLAAQPQTPPPPQLQPQFQFQSQQQPLSFQFPIISQQNYQHFPQPPPPQFTWQAEPLSPEMEAAIMQQIQQQYISSPVMQPAYQIAPPGITTTPLTQPPVTSPPQIEDYAGSKTSPATPVLTTTTQLPLVQQKPEVISTTTPVPASTTTTTTTPPPTTTPTTTTTTTPTTTTTKINYGLYSDSSYGSEYASSYKNYSRDVIAIEKFDHVINKDGYSVEFKSENGIDSKEEGHLKVVPLHDDTKDKKEGPTMGVVHVKSGQVTWTSPECITFTLRYSADERGYRPKIDETPSSSVACLKYGKNFGAVMNANSLPYSDNKQPK